MALTLWASLPTVLDPTLHNLKIAWFDLVGKPTPPPKKKPQLKTTLNQSILQATKLVWSLLLSVLFPVSPWGEVSASQRPLLLAVLILFSGREVCPLSDLPFFSSLLSHPPHGLCNAGWLVAVVPYSHLDTRDVTYLLGTWLKAPKKKPECSGTLKNALDKSDAAGCNCLNCSCNFISFLPTNHTLGKSNLCCNFSSIVLSPPVLLSPLLSCCAIRAGAGRCWWPPTRLVRPCFFPGWSVTKVAGLIP